MLLESSTFIVCQSRFVFCRKEICQKRLLHRFVVLPFFYLLIFTVRRTAIAVYAVFMCMSVRPSVRLSVTSRYCTKTAKHRITQTTPYDSPGTLVCCCQRSRRNSNGVTPPTGAPNRDGIGYNRRFSTNISLYLKNGAR